MLKSIYSGDNTDTQKKLFESQLKTFCEDFGTDQIPEEAYPLIKKRTDIIMYIEEFEAILNYDSGKPLRMSDSIQHLSFEENKEMILKIQIKGLQEELNVVDSLLTEAILEDFDDFI